MAQDNSYINLDTQQQLIDDELRKAKARKDAEMIAKAKEDYENLMKPRKEYTHFEDTMPSGEELMGLLDNPEAVKILAEQYRTNLSKAKDKDLPSIAMESMEGKELLSPEDKAKLSEAAARDMEDYVPGEAGYGRKLFAEQSMNGYTPSRATDTTPIVKVKNIEGIDRGSKKITSFNENEAIEIPEGLLDDPEGNWYLRQLTPQVNEALKAIANKDPSMLQLPEVKELLKRSKIAYAKQNDLLSIAPWTSNPDQTVQVANALREQGDKNLMDAAANLESIRDRQLSATKAMADDLTSQKGILGNVHGQVLGLEGNLVQAAIPSYQQANELTIQSKAVHEEGDNALAGATRNLEKFIPRLTGMGAKKAEVNALINKIKNEGITATNIKEILNDAKRINVRQANREKVEAALTDISNAVTQYERAMIESRRLNESAKAQETIGNSRMVNASQMGGQYHIPEWFEGDNPKQAIIPDDNSAPKTPAEVAPLKQGTTEDTLVPADNSSRTSTKVKNTGTNNNTSTDNPPPPPDNTAVDPADVNGLNASQLATNIKAMGEIWNQRKVKGSKHSLYNARTAEGDSPSLVGDVVVNDAEATVNRFLGNLRALYSNDPKRVRDAIKKVNKANSGALQILKSVPNIPQVLSDEFDNITNSNSTTSTDSTKASDARKAISDQDMIIASYLADLGYV